MMKRTCSTIYGNDNVKHLILNGVQELVVN